MLDCSRYGGVRSTAKLGNFCNKFTCQKNYRFRTVSSRSLIQIEPGFRFFRLKKKSILDNYLQSLFFMLKLKNSQKRRNINVSKSLTTCYLSQTSSIFYIFRSLSTFCRTWFQLLFCCPVFIFFDFLGCVLLIKIWSLEMNRMWLVS